MQYRIIIIDDDREILQVLRYLAEKEDYIVETFERGIPALEKILEDPPHLILLDLMLTDIHGADLLKLLKENESVRHIPVIMLTCRSSVEEKIYGLKIGADDYITKPFFSEELLVRIESVIRRTYCQSEKAETKQDIIEEGDISINTVTHVVSLGKKQVFLSNKEFDLLYLLMSNPEKVMTSDILMERLWGSGNAVYPKTINTNICRLRKKLRPKIAKNIKTVRGLGYKFSSSDI